MKILAEGTINTFCQAIGHIGYPSYIIKGYTKSMMIDAGINLLAPKYYSDLVSLFGEPIALDYVAITHSHKNLFLQILLIMKMYHFHTLI